MRGRGSRSVSALSRLASPKGSRHLPGRTDSLPRVRPDRGNEPVRGNGSERQESYVDASLLGRSSPSSGPLANYVFASLFLLWIVVGGARCSVRQEHEVSFPDGDPGPAMIGGVRSKNWRQMHGSVRIRRRFPSKTGTSSAKQIRRAPGRGNRSSLSERAPAPESSKVQVTPGRKRQAEGKT